MNPVERTRDSNNNSLEADILKYSAIDGVACLVLGLGLYGKFGAQGNAFHPLLNDENIVNGLLVVGAITLALSGTKLLTLMRKKAQRDSLG